MNRVADLALAFCLAVVAMPAVLLAAIAIKLDSPGPALFVQQRVGRRERTFDCLKLRTMRTDTPSLATHEVSPAQITRVGSLLRRYKLDELPQLWNVIRGDMALVGPRPCLPVQHELVEARRARGVYSLRPGITGLAQTRGIDMSEPVRCAETDAEYMAGRSWRGDIAILIATLAVSRSGTGGAA